MEDNLSFFFSGDICVANRLENKWIDSRIEEWILNHDYRVITWEAPIINNRCKPIIKAGPHLNQNNDYSRILTNNLFNLFNIANNHIMDYGIDGLKNTKDILNNYGQTFGAGIVNEEIYKPIIVSRGNIKVGLLACGEAQFGCAKYGDNSKGYAWAFDPIILKMIQSMKTDGIDFIVVCPHGGLEMEYLPLPEWRSHYKSYIDFGADLIVASHPHVIQPIEEYKGKKIFYSLGNFFFNTEKKSSEWYKSIGVSVMLKKDKAKDTISVKINAEKLDHTKNRIILDPKPLDLSYYENLLNDKQIYIEAVNSICVKAWHNYYKKYYNFNSDSQDFLDRIIGHILRRKRSSVSEVMLFHNISIESHRFAVERAIKNINMIEVF